MSDFECSFMPGMRPDPAFLYEDDCCDIIDWHPYIPFTVFSFKNKWNPTFVQLMRRFGVRALEVSESFGWTGDSIAFLEGLVELQAVSISTSRRLDWSILERLPNLESLVLYPRSQAQNDMDFTRLPSLRKCSVGWVPAFESIKKCNRLKSLEVKDSGDLRDLDLRELVNLEQLILNDLGGLRKVELAERARIRGVMISQCPKLKLDLKRCVRDVEYIWLQGRVGFSLDDLSLAKHLKKLQMTFLNNKTPIPPFMANLSRLVDATVIGTRLSESDRKIADDFVASRKARNSMANETDGS